MTEDEIQMANSIASSFIEGCGSPMMLGDAQWNAFEKSGLDMSLFARLGRLPSISAGNPEVTYARSPDGW